MVSINRKSKREEAERFEALQKSMDARLTRMLAPSRKAAPESKPLEDFDTRECERIAAEQPAIVICEEDEDTPATIVDMSANGLRLRFAKPHFLPPTILLDSPAFSGFVVADVKWQAGKEAGVEFDRGATQKLAAPFKQSGKKSSANEAIDH